MALTLKNPDDSETAVSINDLIAEADRLLTLALDGKSPFLVTDAATVFSGLLGKLFSFQSGSTVYTPSTLANYDHIPFAAAASDTALASPEVSDTVNRVVKIDTPSDSLNESLEAHTRKEQLGDDTKEEVYYILEPGFYPQKRYRYAVAELLYEGPGFASVSFLANYNKYNCFRVHNLNDYQMSFAVAGSGFSLTLEPYECKAFRRTDTTTGYLDGLSYLFKAAAGDIRQYSFPFIPDSAVAVLDSPEKSIRANNLANLEIIYRWLNLFIDQTQHDLHGAKLYRNVRTVNDISADYSALFAAVGDSTKIGDLLYHRGTVKHVRTDKATGEVTVTDKTFSGFDTLENDFEFATLTDNGAEFLKIESGYHHDMIPVSSNLFADRPKDMASTVTVGNPENAALDLSVADFEDTPTTSGGLTVSRRTITRLTTDLTGAGIKLTTALDELLTLNFWGRSALTAGNQDTGAATWTNKQFSLTGFGLVMLFNQLIPLSVPLDWVSLYLDADDSHTLSGTTLTRRNALYWTGYGFPDLADILTGTGLDHTLFMTPRRNWHFAARSAVDDALLATEYSGNPFSINELYGISGADFETVNIKRLLEKTEIKLLLKVSHADETTTKKVWPDVKNPNVLRETLANMETAGWYMENRDPIIANDTTTINTRDLKMAVQVAAEHFNNLAAFLNSCEEYTPLNIADGALKYLNDAGNQVALAYSSTGLHGVGIRPKDEFSRFDAGSLEHQAWIDLLGTGAILGFDDLPKSYRDLWTTDRESVTVSIDGELETTQTTIQESTAIVSGNYDSFMGLPLSAVRNDGAAEWEEWPLYWPVGVTYPSIVKQPPLPVTESGVEFNPPSGITNGWTAVNITNAEFFSKVLTTQEMNDLRDKMTTPQPLVYRVDFQTNFRGLKFETGNEYTGKTGEHFGRYLFAGGVTAADRSLWVSCDDVQTRAEALGLKMIVQRAAEPLKLDTLELTGVSVIETSFVDAEPIYINPLSFSLEEAFQSQNVTFPSALLPTASVTKDRFIPLWVTPESAEDVEFIAEHDRFEIAPMIPGDVFAFVADASNSIRGFRDSAGALSQNQENLFFQGQKLEVAFSFDVLARFRNRSNALFVTKPHYPELTAVSSFLGVQSEDVGFSDKAAFIEYASTGFTGGTVAVKVPVSWFSYSDNPFSDSLARVRQRLSNGLGAIQPVAGAVATEPVAETLTAANLTLISTDSKAFRLYFNRSRRKST